MKSVKLSIMLAVALLGSVFCSYAKSVSFQMIQHDKASNDITNSTYLIETAIMDYFFDRGYIVTNLPPVQSDGEEKDQKIYRKSIQLLGKGEADFYVEVYADFDVKASTDCNAFLLSNITQITWKVFSLPDGTELAHGGKKTPKVEWSSDNENGIADFSVEIGIQIMRALKNVR